ncbi:hypothetical protein AMECASPLE_025720 [Ameca splendens]|uniref:Uncharacterized protein n=1 Tax=Ameca splendens TaxID=208324 RepID=A0ABV0YSC3_9TELE
MPECLPSVVTAQPPLCYALFFASKLILFMFLHRQKPELTDHSSLNFGFSSRRFLDNQDYLCLVDFVWISFPSIKLADSFSPLSPEPRQKRNLSTLPHKYLNIGLTPELTRTHSPAQIKPSGFLRYAHLGPDSLYPWRPDYTHLVGHLTVHHNYFSFIRNIIVLVFTSSLPPLSIQLAILPFTFLCHYL